MVRRERPPERGFQFVGLDLPTDGVVCLLASVERVVRVVGVTGGGLEVAVFVELEVDGSVDELVEPAPVRLGGVQVEPVGVAEQGEVLVDDLLASREVDVDLVEPFGRTLPLALDLVEPSLDPVLGNLAVRGQVDEVLFLGVEAVNLIGELTEEESLGLFMIRDGVVHDLTWLAGSRS